jgi:hypothetical protein
VAAGEGIQLSAIRLKPDELDLIARMIDKRASAHLSGHTSDPLRAITPNGGVTILSYPGGMGTENHEPRRPSRLTNRPRLGS